MCILAANVQQYIYNLFKKKIKKILTKYHKIEYILN